MSTQSQIQTDTTENIPPRYAIAARVVITINSLQNQHYERRCIYIKFKDRHNQLSPTLRARPTIKSLVAKLTQ